MFAFGRPIFNGIRVQTMKMKRRPVLKIRIRDEESLVSSLHSLLDPAHPLYFFAFVSANRFDN
jgi:hypothetical protein